MNWFTKFFTSSIGQKIVVAASGLWLVLFLTIHLLGNCQLFLNDNGAAFNHYAHLMENNPLIIYVVRWVTMLAFLLHAFRGLVLARVNKAARGEVSYEANYTKNRSFASGNMWWIGSWILIFWAFHLYSFWWHLMVGESPMTKIDGVEVPDVYTMVATAFAQPINLVIYVVSMVILYLHLAHGFQSAFQTFGLNHKKYSPIISGIGMAYSIIVPLLFALMPIYFFFFN
jgi:succinate dehydrogenase / fumarate reductase cytochrome b subunit